MASDGWMDILREAIKRQRRHAPFFSWFDRSPSGKAVAEKGVVESLLESMNATGRAEYFAPRATGRDWPDCEAKNAAGKSAAFEVTEFVDAAALSHKTEPRQWSHDEIVARLAAILEHKDQRGFGAGYDETVLLIHTDEFYLDATKLETLLSAQRFLLRHRNVTRAFLLFGYSPQLGRCPYIELQLAA